jgi:hypothetical protein
MSTESKDFDPYAIVLADLKAQRDRIDQAIQAIESVRAGGSQASAAVGPQRPQETVLGDGAFHGMSISEATKKLLGVRKKKMTNTEILAELKAGGMVLTSVDPLNTVGAVLTRRFKEVGDIVRVERGTWGLKEWHPGRTWKKDKEPKPEAAPKGGDWSSDPNAFAEPTESE